MAKNETKEVKRVHTKKKVMKEDSSKKSRSPSIKQISKFAYETALSCYGIAGVVRFDCVIKNDYTPLDEDHISLGVFVRKKLNDTFSVDLFVLIANHVKLTEAIFECQKVVRYALNKKFGQRVRHIHIYAMGLAQ